MNKYEPDLQAMRYELEGYVKITENTPDSHIVAFHKMLTWLYDDNTPNREKRRIQLIFELVSDGDTDYEDKLEVLNDLENRNAIRKDDYMGEWIDD